MSRIAFSLSFSFLYSSDGSLSLSLSTYVCALPLVVARSSVRGACCFCLVNGFFIFLHSFICFSSADARYSHGHDRSRSVCLPVVDFFLVFFFRISTLSTVKCTFFPVHQMLYGSIHCVCVYLFHHLIPYVHRLLCRLCCFFFSLSLSLLRLVGLLNVVAFIALLLFISIHSLCAYEMYASFFHSFIPLPKWSMLWYFVSRLDRFFFLFFIFVRKLTNDRYVCGYLHSCGYSAGFN